MTELQYIDSDFQKDEKERIAYNKRLVKRYPWLGLRIYDPDIDSYIQDPDDDYKSTWLDSMPDGWRKAFGLKMCKEIQKELKKYNYVDKYVIIEIKEKFGGLRWYDGGYPIGILSDDYEEIIIKAGESLPEYDRNNYVLKLDHTEHYISLFDKEKSQNMTAEEIKEYNKKAVSYYHLYKLLEKCKIGDIINKYEDISYSTCITCGKPAKWISTGWISPFCDDCKNTMIKDKMTYMTEKSFNPIEEVYSK